MAMRGRGETWIKHTLRQRRWQPQRQLVALGALGFFIALILGALYLSQVASEVTLNRRLSTLLNTRDELERTNEQLKAETAGLKAVPRLQAQAEALGFVLARQDQIEYLPVRNYVPPQPDTVAPIAVIGTGESQVYDETFTGWLEQQWDSLSKSIGDLIGR